MHEGDAPAVDAPARDLVDQTIAGRPAPLERSIEVRDAVADVMDPRPARGEKLRDRAGGVAGLEQLDLDVAERQPDDRRPVCGCGALRLETEDVAVERTAAAIEGTAMPMWAT